MRIINILYLGIQFAREDHKYVLNILICQDYVSLHETILGTKTRIFADKITSANNQDLLAYISL
jgi:hypothetical protein